ncbi:hypothetical protein [Niastella sp. OAS944]|uniref:hypothetical protein n=1 Tax=Niastella sp. OAS944 TaxID=2664089 RepID=UPI00346F1B24|nr:hypothetical protein [Chitinophagaceae bacterium OAS944]
MDNLSINARLERFYSLEIPAVLPEICSEQQIPNMEADNLFAAHLHINNALSGALDKTLSGFVILEVAGDDYYLFDARDSGWVYCMSHIDRRITNCFQSLEAYRAFRQQSSGHPILTQEPESKRAVSTLELAERYQWTVWFFGRMPGKTEDAAFEERWMAFADNWFANATGGIDNIQPMFDEEKPFLKEDVHLAVWWLLVATALTDENLINEIIQLGPDNNELFHSFAQELTPLGFHGNLTELPEFKKRRARFLYRAAKPDSKLLDFVTDANTLYHFVRDLMSRSLIIDPEEDLKDKIHILNICCEELNDPQFMDGLKALIIR